MGLAFLSQIGKQFRKRWDEHRIRLSTPDLFGQLAKSVKTVVVKPMNGFKFGKGQKFEVAVSGGDRFCIYYNRQLVGICDDPALSLVQAAEAVGGKVLGLFHEMREHSGFADIIICVEPEPTAAETAETLTVEEHEKRYRTKTAP